jgi:hypothetical protein
MRMTRREKTQAVKRIGVTFLIAVAATLVVVLFVEEVYKLAYPLKGGGTLFALFSRRPGDIFLTSMFLSFLYGPPVAFIARMYSKFPIFCQRDVRAVGITLAASLLTSLWISGFVTFNHGGSLYLIFGQTIFAVPFLVPWLLGAHFVYSALLKTKNHNLWKIYTLVFVGSTALIYLISVCFGSPPPEPGEILLAYWWFLLPAILGFSSLITGIVSDTIINRRIVREGKVIFE